MNVIGQVSVSEQLYTFVHALWMQSAPIGELSWGASEARNHCFIQGSEKSSKMCIYLGKICAVMWLVKFLNLSS